VTKPAVPSGSSSTGEAAAESTVKPGASAPAAGSTPRGRRRFNRRLLVPLLGLLVIVGVVATQVLPQFLAPKQTDTVWESITSGIQNDSVPKQTALEAFAYLYKVNLPGVTVPAGRDGGDAPTSGSGALRWVQANWTALTPDQQAVINRYTTPGPNDRIVHLDATASAPSPAIVLAVSRNLVPARAQLGGAPVDLATVEQELLADIKHIGPKLGLPPISQGSLLWKNVTLDLSDKDGGKTLLQTDAVQNLAGVYSPCNVTVWKNAWQNEQVTSSGGVSPALHVLMTHEVIHCYQNVIWNDVSLGKVIPSWITEGTALWLAADDTKIAEAIIPAMWQNGYFKPEIALSNRTYDAFGFYAFLAHQGRDLWSLMVPAWKAAAASSEHSNAFIAVLQGDAPDIRNNWAESYLRQSDWGDPWIAYGFGLPDAAQVVRHDAQAQPSPGWVGSLLSRSNTVLDVSSSYGEVVTISTDGLASVHDNSGNSDTALGSERFCTIVGGCVCPKGTLEAGADMASHKLSIPFAVAFNAPYGGSHYSIVGEKLDDLCGKPPTPQPIQTNPCGPNCSTSNGDPHLWTVNSYRYDFQAAGEFTLLRSPDGSLEIQARQEPFAGSIGGVSTNTAIAAKVGGHRVAIYASGGALQAKVDGVAADLTSPMDLGGGGRIATYPKGFEIDFPDGTKMWTLSLGHWGINAQISPSASLKASGLGLLGPIVPGGLGVPALPNGTRLPAATDSQARHNAVYVQYADAWRVTDSTTLFDYDPGKSTATYTIKGYPSDTADVTISDLTAVQKAAGTSACSAITDSGLHDDCVFDVGVTGEIGFAASYQATQSFYDSGIALPTPAAAPTPGASGSVSGAMQVIQGNRLAGFALGPDNMVYVSEAVSSTQSTLLEVDPNAGKIVHQVGVPAATEVHVAGDSVWLPGLKTDSHGNNCSVTRFDASTLAEQATIPIPCTSSITGPQIISDGSAVWFVDVSKYDVGTLKGAVLTRIDPTTNALGPSVDLPFINGGRMDSQGALFYQDASIKNTGYYRLTTGTSAMEPLGQFKSQVRAAGTGLWVTSDDDHSAEYFTSAGAPQVTLPISGLLVGGDITAAYVEILGKDPTGTKAAEQLWRYPIDGSTPTLLGYSPTVNDQNYSYFNDPPAVTNGNGFLKLWSPLPSSGKTPTVFLQWIPLK
jgi:hypothetical protein